MKKKLTYPLLVLVALIWGLIIYRIVKGNTDNGEQGMVIPHAKPRIAEVQRSAPLPALMLDYRDPFLEEAVSAPIAVAPAIAEEAVPVAAETDWSVIRYMGAILNPRSGKLVFLLNIAGQDHLMETGGQKAGVEIIKGNSDSVLVNYLGKQRFITKG